jgi:capsular polysaccharide biosynthesis protein
MNNVRLNKMKSQRLHIYVNEYIFFDHWSLNYFHWFTDVIPKLLFVLNKKSDIRLLIPDWLYKVEYVHQSLNLIDGITVTVFSKTALVINAKIVNLGYTSGNYNSQLIMQERGILAKAGIVRTALSPKRLFVFRSVETKRGVLNFDELIPVLEKYHIVVIDFSKYSWVEQYSIVASAEILIGVHGAGLTNMLFMKEGSTIFELRRKDDDHNNCYFNLADACEHRYWYQLCEVDNVSIETQQNNFYVDVDIFENNLRKMLNI